MAKTEWVLRSATPTTITASGSAVSNDAGDLSGVISNESDGDQFGDFELVATWSTAPNSDALVEAYIVRTVDGTNYEDNNTEGRPRSGFIGGYIVDNVTSSQRLMLRGVPLPPRDFKVYLLNKTGQTMGAGWTHKIVKYTPETV